MSVFLKVKGSWVLQAPWSQVVVVASKCARGTGVVVVVLFSGAAVREGVIWLILPLIFCWLLLCF